MPFLDRDSARIHYETIGEEGPWVTLVNGHTRSLTDFRSLSRYFAERGWRTLALDNRGAGATTFASPFTVEDMAEDVRALWRALAIERSHLLGISLGGMICAHLAARARSGLASLTLVSTSACASAVETREATTPEEIERNLLAYFSPSFAEKNRLFVRALVKETSKAFTDAGRAALARAQRSAMRGFDISSELSAISVPTLVVHGDADGIIDIAEGCRLAQGISGARLHIFPGAGHLLLAERPRELFVLVERFCRETEALRP